MGEDQAALEMPQDVSKAHLTFLLTGRVSGQGQIILATILIEIRRAMAPVAHPIPKAM